jgi:hypothetical protein
MPKYPANKTYRGGFYNNKQVNGVDDRVYTAADMRKPYDVVFSDGLLPDSDGTAGEGLRVSQWGDLGIQVAAGKAKLGGAWFENDSAYNIELDAATSADRYDCVIIRNDDSDDVREPLIYIKSLSAVPTVADLERSASIYEICVAYVRVPAMAAYITADNIIDTRMDGGLCRTMSGVGATVVRTYRNTVFSDRNNQTEINIGIPQYDKSRDTLIVTVEGRVFAEGDNYSVLSNSSISLNIGLPVIGTRVGFQVLKNVNAAGAETVIQEVSALREEMTAANKFLEQHYYCNGLNDNIVLTEKVRAFLRGEDYKTMRIIIHGTFGATTYYSGKGDLNEPYRWFDFSVQSNRRVILNFGDCSQLNIPVVSGFYNHIFYGSVQVEDATVIVNQTADGTACVVFGTPQFNYYAKNCRFYVTARQHSYIANAGTFDNCRGSVANSVYYAYCFYPTDDSLLRVNGGEYYSYRGDSSRCAVVGHAGATAVTILHGVNCPTLERTGYTQQYAVYQQNSSGTGVLSCTDLVSTLPIEVISGLSNVRGTIALNKAGKM